MNDSRNNLAMVELSMANKETGDVRSNLYKEALKLATDACDENKKLTDTNGSTPDHSYHDTLASVNYALAQDSGSDTAAKQTYLEAAKVAWADALKYCEDEGSKHTYNDNLDKISKEITPLANGQPKTPNK